MENNEKFILEDKKYFKQAIFELLELSKIKHIPIDKTKHVAKHSNGTTNIAFFNPETDIITQFNDVSEKSPNGKSVLKYKLHD